MRKIIYVEQILWKIIENIQNKGYNETYYTDKFAYHRENSQ